MSNKEELLAALDEIDDYCEGLVRKPRCVIRKYIEGHIAQPLPEDRERVLVTLKCIGSNGYDKQKVYEAANFVSDHYNTLEAALQAPSVAPKEPVDVEGLKKISCEFVCGGYNKECGFCQDTCNLIDHITSQYHLTPKENKDA